MPAIVSAPGRIPAGRVSSVPITTADFFPTLLAAAGVRPGNPEMLDGVNLLPMLTQNEMPDRDALFWHYPHFSPRAFSAVRAGRWKLLEFFEETGVRPELYDLANDLGEKSDLSQEEPERVRELQSRLAAWRNSVGAKLPVCE